MAEIIDVDGPAPEGFGATVTEFSGPPKVIDVNKPPPAKPIGVAVTGLPQPLSPQGLSLLQPEQTAEPTFTPSSPVQPAVQAPVQPLPQPPIVPEANVINFDTPPPVDIIGDIPAVEPNIDTNVPLLNQPEPEQTFDQTETLRTDVVRPAAKETLKRLGIPLAKGGNALISGAGGALEFIGNVMPEPPGTVDEKIAANLRKSGQFLGKYAKTNRALLESVSASKQPFGVDAEGNLTVDKTVFADPKYWTDTFIEGFTNLSQAYIMGGGTIAGGAVVGSILEAGPYYQELKEKNDPNAEAKAASFGMAVALLEKIGLDAIFDNVPAGTGRKLLQTAIGAVTEGGTEWGEDPVQALIDQIGREGGTLKQGWEDVARASKTGLNNFVAGLVSAGPTTAINVFSQTDQGSDADKAARVKEVTALLSEVAARKKEEKEQEPGTLEVSPAVEALEVEDKREIIEPSAPGDQTGLPTAKLTPGKQESIVPPVAETPIPETKPITKEAEDGVQGKEEGEGKKEVAPPAVEAEATTPTSEAKFKPGETVRAGRSLQVFTIAEQQAPEEADFIEVEDDKGNTVKVLEEEFYTIKDAKGNIQEGVFGAGDLKVIKKKTSQEPPAAKPKKEEKTLPKVQDKEFETAVQDQKKAFLGNYVDAKAESKLSVKEALKEKLRGISEVDKEAAARALVDIEALEKPAEEPTQEPVKPEEPAKPVKKKKKAAPKAEKPKPSDKVEIKKEGKDATVKADITAKEEKKVTGREQKKFLLTEIDVALEAAPDEQLTKKTGTVTIEVPNDGVFQIHNTKAALEQFKKLAGKFPTTVPKSAEPGKKATTATKPAPIAKKRPSTFKDTRKLVATAAAKPSSNQRPILQETHLDGETGELVATDNARMNVALGVKGQTTKHDGNYPNYENVIPGYKQGALPKPPKGYKKHTVSTADVTTAANKVIAMSKGEPATGSEVYLMPDGTIALSAEIKDVGEVQTDEVEKGKLLTHAQAVNLKEAMDFARRMGNETVDIYIKEAGAPIIITGKNEYSIVMPTRPEEVAETQSDIAQQLSDLSTITIANDLPLKTQNVAAIFRKRVKEIQDKLDSGEFTEKQAIGALRGQLKTTKKAMEHFNIDEIPSLGEIDAKIQEINDLITEPADRAPVTTGDASTVKGGPTATFEGAAPEGTPAEGKLWQRTRDLIKKYANKTGEGHLPKDAIGVFYGRTRNIFINSLNNISTAVHEVAHAVQDETGVIADATKVTGHKKDGQPIYSPASFKLRKQLSKVYLDYYGGAKQSHRVDKKVKEGLATLIQIYIERPRKIRSEFPYLVKEIIDSKGKYHHPLYKEIIRDGRSIVEDFTKLSPVAQVEAKMAERARKYDANNKVLTKRDKIVRFLMDKVTPIEKIERMVGINWEQTADSPSLWFRLYESIGRLTKHNMGSMFRKETYWAVRDGAPKKVFDFNWKTMVNNIAATTRPETYSAYLLARRYHFDYQRLDKLEVEADNAKDRFETIKKDLKDGNIVVDAELKKELDEIKATIERFERLDRILKKDNEDRASMDSVYEEYNEEYSKLDDMFDKLVRADLDTLREAGMISQKSYTQLASNEGYARFMRDIYDEIVGEGLEETAVSVGGTKVKALLGRKGSELPKIDPIYAHLLNHSEVMRKAAKQIVRNKVVEMADQLPDLFQKQDLITSVDKQTGVISYPQEKDPNILMGMFNGVRQPYLANKEIKTIIDTLLDPASSRWIGRATQWASRLMVKGTTGMWLAFGPQNKIVDSITAAAQTRANYVPLVSEIGFVKDLLKKDNSAEAQYFEEYLTLAGVTQTTSGWLNNTKEDFVKSMRGEISALRKISETVESVADIFALPSQTSEILTRAIEYANARKAGDHTLIALEKAGRVTAAFHHSGSGSYIINGIPYFNAAIQVLGEYSSALSNKDRRNRAIFVTGAVTAAMVAQFINMWGSGSEEQKEKFEELHPNELGLYMWFPHPNGKDLLRFRVPEQMAWMGTAMGMAMQEGVKGTNYRAKDYIDVATGWIPDQFNITDPVRAITSWFPQLIRPVIDVTRNSKSWPKVMPLQNQSQMAKEPAFRFYPSTSKMAKWLGERMEVSPIVIDHLIEGYFGRTAKYFTGKPGTLQKTLNPFEREMYFQSGRTLNRYYEVAEETQRLKNSLDNDRREFTNEEREVILNNADKVKAIRKDLKIFEDIDINSTDAADLRRMVLDNIDSLEDY